MRAIPTLILKSDMKSLNFAEKITSILFIILAGWWAVLYFYYGAGLTEQNLYWAATYQVLAVWGGLLGFLASRSWGGIRSRMGRSAAFLSIGLLLQAFGQSSFSYYTTILNVGIPYPSIADVGYFGSVLFYIIGIYSLARVSGASVTLKKYRGKGLVVVIPAILLIFSYNLFLSSYQFDWSNPLRVFLDFGYPIGQAIYVSIAVLAFILSKDVLGGIMRGPIIFVVYALVIQYFADSNFLFQTINGTWINGGYGDFLYTFAYFLMAISLVKIYGALKQPETGSTILP